MPACSNCDEYVTRDFIRVFGIEGEIYGCPHCSTYRELCNANGVDNPSTGMELSHLREI